MIRAGLGKAAVLATFALSACTEDFSKPSDRFEIANMKSSNFVPKSKPAQLVNAFERHCVNAAETTSARDAALRSDGYVPLPGRPGASHRSYVTDNRRPMVISSRTGTSCSVVAEPVTGQAARISDFVNSELGPAKRLSLEGFPEGVERAWAVSTPRPATVSISRRGLFDTDTTVMVAYMPAAGEAE